MKAELRAGATIDFLSPAEYSEGVETLHREIRKLSPRDYFQQSHRIEPVTSGNGSVVLYEVPLGSNVIIHRLSVASPGYGPQSPLANGSVEFLLNGTELSYFLPVQGIVAPAILTEGSDGLVILSGQSLEVRYDNLTDPLNIFIQFRRWNA